jgi:hypothetical protein
MPKPFVSRARFGRAVAVVSSREGCKTGNRNRRNDFGENDGGRYLPSVWPADYRDRSRCADRELRTDSDLSVVLGAVERLKGGSCFESATVA